MRARAPGRGAWIGVDRADARDGARPRASCTARSPVLQDQRRSTVPDDLGERIEAALRQAALDRLGLEARAGNLVTGADKIETAARARRRSHLLLHAADAGEDGRRKLDQAWRVGSDEEGSGRQGLVFPLEGPYCRWRWAARMWYMSPSSTGPRRRVFATRSTGGALLSDVMLG